MKPKVSIVIVNWNTLTLLKECLNSIINNQSRPKVEDRLEVIVVDNGSTDNSVEFVRKFKIQNSKFKIILMENKDNLGFARANNQGIEAAKGEYILLLNSDTIIKDKAISKTVEWMDQHPEVDVVGCKLLNPDGTDQKSVGQFPTLFNVFKMLFLDFVTGGWSMTSPDQSKPVDWIMGAFFMARSKCFEEIGGLDENIFMYMEEVEWCYRAKRENKVIYFYPGAEIIHLKGGSSKTGKTGPILNIYKGLVYFYGKHMPKWKKAVVIFMLKLKAGGTWLIGMISNNSYLKETYGKAYQLV